ncbi:MAG: hypothetical protein IKW74_03920, partial [Thermoguttaceae bacterium]|nr:hypothetical protein [Thermoguttaceae bacterium]
MQRCFTYKKNYVHKSRTIWRWKFGHFFDRQVNSPSRECHKKIRVESLEERALLSVTPMEYAAIRDHYSDLELASGLEDMNIIELMELTANALQQAVDEAAQTEKPDIILINTGQFDTPVLPMENVTISISFDASRFGDLSILSWGGDRLQISVNQENWSFDVGICGVQFGGVDFVDIIDPGLTYRYVQSYALDSIPGWAEQECDYYSVGGELINDCYSLEYQVERNFSRLDEYFSVQANATGNTNDYAVLFVGGSDASNNRYDYYSSLVKFYTELTTDIGLDPENIYILYADGDTTGESLNCIRKGTYLNGDMSFATGLGTSVYAAKRQQLDNVMAEVASKMTNKSHLVFYTSDHGFGTDNDTTNYNDRLCGWGEYINGANIRDAIYQISHGYVTSVFGQCYSGGILDDIFDPKTGEQITSYTNSSGKDVTYTGTAHFAGCAATNHYEPSWTNIASDGTCNGDFLTGFINGILIKKTTTDLFQYTVDNDPFHCTTETYERNGGTFHDHGVEHPWYAGETFNVFFDSSEDDGDDGYEPNDTVEAAFDLGTVKSEKTISALIAGANKNQDWFKFNIINEGNSDSYIQLTYSHGTDVDIVLNLWDASGNPLASSVNATGTEKISLEGYADGTYYIQVYNYCSNTVGVDYTLTINPPLEKTDWVVTSTDDSATTKGTLRYAVAHAVLGDTITFDDSLRGQTITLSGNEIEISKSITIDASNLMTAEGKPGITISGNNESRIFTMDGETCPTVSLIGLTLTGGNTSDEGGAVLIAGTLTLNQCVITGNKSSDGGGVAITSRMCTLNVVHCEFSGNKSNYGGAIYCNWSCGVITVTDRLRVG